MEWLDEHWMFLAPPVTLCLVIYRFVLAKKDDSQQVMNPKLEELLLWGWLAMPLYAFHQFEEHGYDVYGRRYHFIEYFNSTKPLGIEMTPRFITYINLIQVHLFFGIYARRAEMTQDALFVALTHGLCAANAALAHIMPAVLTQSYNPGLAQSLFMAPCSIQVLYKYYLYCDRKVAPIIACAVFGTVWGHGLCLLVPLKLVSIGVFGELGFVLWASALLVIYPLLAKALLGSSNKTVSSSNKGE